MQAGADHVRTMGTRREGCGACKQGKYSRTQSFLTSGFGTVNCVTDFRARRFQDITAPPSVCVPAVLGVLAVWIQNQKNSIYINIHVNGDHF